ncbi:TPR repeat-containing protein [Acrasis kona]|uniref:TPR repeat-containing protein n=1 Tax=Acrasis kona TaxID=1008807 RepID=A0AAW2YNN4_9EUKA
MDEEDFEELMRNGLDCLRNESFEQAVSWFKLAMPLEPYNAEAPLNMARSLEKLGLLEESIAFYKQSSELDPLSVDSFSERGALQTKLGLYDDAIDSYENASQLDPSKSHFYLKGEILQHVGRCEDALFCFDKCLQIEPHDVDCLYRKALALFDLNRYDEALELIGVLLQDNPRHTETILLEISVYVKLDRLQDALICCNKILEQPRARLHKCQILRTTGNYDTALSCINQGLQIETRAEYEVERGLILSAVGDDVGALTCFEESIRLDPGCIDGYYKMALLLCRQGNHAEAISFYDQALSIDPYNYYLIYNRGMECAHTCNFDEAFEYIRTALVSEPDFNNEIRRYIDTQDHTLIVSCSTQPAQQTLLTLEIERYKAITAQHVNVAELIHHKIIKVPVTSEEELIWTLIVTKRVKTQLEVTIEQEALTSDQLKNVMTGLLKGLQSLHELGLIHCNIKPSRVGFASASISSSDDVKILDFGSCVEIGERPHLFTPEWAAPESITQPAHHKMDIYSAGLILQKCLLFVPSLQEKLNMVVNIACQEDANQRYNSALEMLQDVETFF